MALCDSMQAVADLYEHRLLAFLKALKAQSEDKQGFAGRFVADLRQKLNFLREHEKTRREHILQIACETTERVMNASLGDNLRVVGSRLALEFDEAKMLSSLAEKLRVYENTKTPTGLLRNLLHTRKNITDTDVLEILREISLWSKPARVEEQVNSDISPLERELASQGGRDTACFKEQYMVLAKSMRAYLERLWNGADVDASIAEQKTYNEEFDRLLKADPVLNPTVSDEEGRITVRAKSSYKTLFLVSAKRLDAVTLYPFSFDDFRKIFALTCAGAVASDEDGRVLWQGDQAARFVYPLEISEHYVKLSPPASMIRDRILTPNDYMSRDGKLIVHPAFSPDIRNVLVLSCAEKRLQTLEEANDYPDARLLHLSSYQAAKDELTVLLNAGVQNITLIGLSPEGIERVYIPEVYVGERYKVNYTIEGAPSHRKETMLKIRFTLESSSLFSAPACYRLPEMELRMSYSGLMRKEDGEILCYVNEVVLDRTPAGKYEKLVSLEVPKTRFQNARIKLFFRNDTDAYQLFDVR